MQNKSQLLKEYSTLAIFGLIFFISLDIVLSISSNDVDSFKKFLESKYIFTLAPMMTCVIAVALGLLNFIAKNPIKTGKKKRDNIIFVLGYMFIVVVLVLVGIATRNVEIITFEHFGIGYMVAVIIVIAAVTHLICTSIKTKKA
jgi:hypothetical protein